MDIYIDFIQYKNKADYLSKKFQNFSASYPHYIQIVFRNLDALQVWQSGYLNACLPFM